MLTLFGARYVRSKPATAPDASGRRSGSPGRRVPSLEQPDDAALAHLAGQPERSRAAADPGSGRLALARVVVLAPLRDLVDVVAPGRRTRCELADTQHPASPSRRSRPIGQINASGASLAGRAIVTRTVSSPASQACSMSCRRTATRRWLLSRNSRLICGFALCSAPQHHGASLCWWWGRCGEEGSLADRPWKFGGVVQGRLAEVAGRLGGVVVDFSGVLVRSSERVLDVVDERCHVAAEPHACTRTPSGAGKLGLRAVRLPSGVHGVRRDDIEAVRAEMLSGFAELTEDVPPSPFARPWPEVLPSCRSGRDCRRAANA